MARIAKPQRRSGKIARFFKEIRNEMKKVAWPNREELRSHTTVVIVVTLIMAAFIGVLDFGFSLIVRFILER